MGLDCRTAQKQNQGVLAAAEGYIAKVKIQPGGFGRVIYINHPNGLTTLYAHLNEFFPELEEYVKKQQYNLKSWKVDLDIPANLFPVPKGFPVAFSGNTGASEGPHLHFEIRNTITDKVLNPLLFGLPIPDSVAPNILRLAVYNRLISTYEQAPKIYTIKKTDSGYISLPPLLISNSDKLSFAITAFDSYSGSKNRNGIFEAVLFNNEVPIVGFQIDDISYDETRDINAHIDHKFRSTNGLYLQHLSKLPGYDNSIYKMINGDGVLTLEKDSIHQIRVDVKDANGNTSVLRFNIKLDSMVIPGRKTDSSAYFQPTEFHPGFINIFENARFSFYLPETSLYDSIRFQYREITPNAGFPIYQIHTPNIPVHGYFPVKIKGNIPLTLKDKVVMVRQWNGRKDFVKAVYENGWYKGSFREFGNFQLMIDTIPPVITPIKFRNGMKVSKLTRLAFVIADNTGQLKDLSATLDGNWLRFINDRGKTFVYTFDENCPPGEHELILTAEDGLGNKTEKKYHFTR